MSRANAKSDFITLAGGGELDAATLSRALSVAPTLCAVDGGADRVLALGHQPHKVFGDLDSISDAARARLDAAHIIETPDQNETDFDKALRAVDAPLVMAVGFTGLRLDHTLAAMSTLWRFADRRVILDSGHDLCVLCPPEVRLALPKGARVSLYPMVRMKCASEGLEWATAGLTLDPAGRIGTSNRALGGDIVIAPEAPGMLLLLPIDALEALITALRDAPLWPAPAHGQ